jgi:hypothetical protein
MYSPSFIAAVEAYVEAKWAVPGASSVNEHERLEAACSNAARRVADLAAEMVKEGKVE